MRNLLNRHEDECGRLRGFLEDAAAERPEATGVKDFLELLPPEVRPHFEVCRDCQLAAEDLLTVRKILKTSPPAAAEAGPWFAGRVMAAIAAREKELEEAARIWLVLPRFASRLALVSAGLLLISSAWLYERPSFSKKAQSDSANSEYLFEPPQPPVSQDDVLVSMAERKP